MNTKSWYQSKTIWSDVLTFVMSVLPFIHPIDPVVNSAILAGLGAVGIYGRSTANTKID